MKKYHLQVSDLPDFEQCIIDTQTEVVGYLSTLLDTTVKYWWKMKVQTKRYNAWSDWTDAWWFVVKSVPNRAPETPNTPSPPDGATDVSIDLSLYWNGGDKDGDTVIYTIYLGEDSIFTEPLDTVMDSSGGIITTVGYELQDTLQLHTAYYWKVDAQDNDTISPGPIWHFRTCSIPPPPPNKPEQPSSSLPHYIDEAITFTTTATDPEGRDVAYKFSFGDGHQSQWTGWVASGEPGSVSHIYRKLGAFYVKAKAQNTAYRESEWSDSIEVPISVGPGACWVADYHGNKVVKLGRGGSWICQFDDQHEWPWGSPGGMKSPSSLCARGTVGYCWVACTYDQVVFQLAPSCSGVVHLQGSEVLTGNNPSTPCVDGDGNCWMTLAWDKKFVKFERYTGNILQTIVDDIPGEIYPIAIGIDEPYIWVVETSFVTDGYLAKFDITTGARIFRIPFFNGTWVEVDPVTHWCWVADEMNDRVVKVSPDGNTVNYIWGFDNPCCVSVNINTHECWVADRENDRVVKLSEAGDKIVVKDGFKNPTGVAVDPNDGSCWVSDAGNHRVVKLSPDGDILFTVSGFTTPMGLSVNPEPE